MKIVEAFKKIKSLNVKADDLRKRVADNCALLSVENPKYGTVEEQRAKVKSWLDAHTGVMREIQELRRQITYTNTQVSVTIQLGENSVTKTIAEWLVWKNHLLPQELAMWQGITDRGLKSGTFPQSDGQTATVELVRFYDADLRDRKVDWLKAEENEIDAKLEVVNASTDLKDISEDLPF